MKMTSWIIIDKKTNKAVRETFSAKLAGLVNQEKFKVMTAGDYLGNLNEAVAKQ